MNTQKGRRAWHLILVSVQSMAALALLANGASASLSDVKADCFPGCREGYLCNAEKKCVSACNPPCESGETCKASACILTTRQSISSTEPAEPAEPAGKTSDSNLSFSVLGGPRFLVIAKLGSALGAEAAFQMRFGFGTGTHGLTAGIRAGAVNLLGFSGSTVIGTFGFDVGYTGRFRFRRGNAGPLLMLTPQIWTVGDSVLSLGASVGGRVQIGEIFELQVPLTVSYLKALGDGYGSARVGFQSSLLLGASF
jgi:hypothetical protein